VAEGEVASVAVVVPNWNTAAYLERCLAALAVQGDVKIEMMVVDNGSRDDSLELIKRAGIPHIALPTNIGFAAAVNLGVARTTAPFVLVLNADCYPARNCVQELAAALAADDGLGGVQPCIVADGTASGSVRIASTGQCLTRSGAEFERGWGEPASLHHSHPREIFGVCGTACLLRRALFAELGGYDPAYFAFYEDVDLNARARLAGWRFAYVPDARAIHEGHVAWRQCPGSLRFNVELSVRNRLAMAVKVLPPSGILGAVVSTLRALIASPFRGTTAAVLAGALGTLRWLPRLLSERRRLRRGSVGLLDTWLTRKRGPGPDPGRIAGSALSH
jgi:GT2 family glycosyltransferase